MNQCRICVNSKKLAINLAMRMLGMLSHFGGYEMKKESTESTLLFAGIPSYENLLSLIKNNGSVEEIKVLIDAGADVNAKDKDGMTALMYAAKDNDNPEVIKAIIDAGAVVTDEAIDYAKNNKDIYKTDAYWLMLDHWKHPQ